MHYTKEEAMVKPIRTIILDQYLWKFIVRILIVIAVTVLYITNRDIITDFLTQPVFQSLVDRRLWPLVALWGILMVMMATHFIPPKIFTMALLKRKKEKLDMDDSFDKGKLLEYVQEQNLRAWHVMLVWVLLNGIVGMLYLFGILKVADLFMVSVFYFLCDYVCILIYCPFQSHIMHNKCCVNCRIYDWGHFMMFTPMIFIRHFFSWTLFWMSVLVLIRWEIVYARYPERFWDGSNRTLRCTKCADKTCQIKKLLAK